MKKKIAFLLAALLTLCLSTVAFANAAEVSKEDQMEQNYEELSGRE